MRLERDLFRRLCAARELMRRTADPLSVRAVAARVRVSPHHFIRRFEALFGTTPARFRSAWRVERARELLALGDLSVTDVCLEVGFASLGTFSALFKERVGCSPSEYRRRVREQAGSPEERARLVGPGCLSLLERLPAGAFRDRGEAASGAAGHARGAP